MSSSWKIAAIGNDHVLKRIDNELQEKPLKWYPSQETHVQKEHSEKHNLILVILHLKPAK